MHDESYTAITIRPVTYVTKPVSVSVCLVRISTYRDNCPPRRNSVTVGVITGISETVMVSILLVRVVDDKQLSQASPVSSASASLWSGL